jgi:transcriptional regulator with XRE-family HTH domain
MDADINELIAKRVEERRTRLGMTLTELARATGLPSSTLEKLERQYRGCSAADLWRVARVLNVSITDLCPSRPTEPPSATGPDADGQAKPGRTWRDKFHVGGPMGKGPRKGVN